MAFNRQPLPDRREQMEEFLLENIVSDEEIRKIDNNKLRFRQGKNEYLLNMITRPSDFQYTFNEDAHKQYCDSDAFRLISIQQAMADYIHEVQMGKDTKGMIPIFMFLRAETDYEVVDGVKTDARPNDIGYLKQAMLTRKEVEDGKTVQPNYSIKHLDPVEYVAQLFYRLNEVNKDKSVIRNNLRHRSGNLYFNTKENRVEEMWVTPLVNPKDTFWTECPSCEEENYVKDHTECHDLVGYTMDAEERNAKRYRHHISKRRVREEGKGLKFQPAQITSQQLLDSLETPLYIGILK